MNRVLVATVVNVENRMASMKRRVTVAHQGRERGAAMAEYGLLLALVALAAISILVLFGGEIREVFVEAEESIANRGEPEAD